MRLTNLSDGRVNGTRTISMDLEWEDCDRSAQTLYFAVDSGVADMLHASPDAFAIACLPMAAWLGETRMQVEGQLCTQLRAGLKVIN